MARYGVPYKGSKNAIAPWVIRNLPHGTRFVDLFAGGCAVTHAAMLSTKWDRLLANDIGTAHLLFRDAIHGRLRNRTEWVSRELFFMLKDTDPFVKFAWSFGNDGESYLYSRELEPYKRAVHMELTAHTVSERYVWHRESVRHLARLVTKTSLQSLRSLQSLESLERLQSLERLESLERLQFTQMDYRKVPLADGDVVYCDIPYYSTSTGKSKQYGNGFDYDAFYAWAVETAKRLPVFISEYAMPPDRFRVVAEVVRTGHMSAAKNNNRCVEKLFVPIVD